MENNNSEKRGSYIVRDKKGTYMGGYSEKLGKANCVSWATECAKRSMGVLYYRQSPEEPEEEIGRFLDFGRKKRVDKNKKKDA